jgi:hypothetical protein
MSSLNSLYLKLSTLKEMVDVLERKQENGIELTISINDKLTIMGNQNVSAFVAQTKEQREAKTNKFYVGNGRTVWTDGKIQAFEYKKDSGQEKKAESDKQADETDLPLVIMINITNEDNMKLMARYEDKHFDLAIVDPPYGIGK